MARPHRDHAAGSVKRVHFFPTLGALRFQLPLELCDLGLELKDATDADERHALAGHLPHPLHLLHLGTAVSALPAFGARRLDELLGIEPAQEGRLHAEHPRDLTHRVERRVVVVDRQGEAGQGSSKDAGHRDTEDTETQKPDLRRGRGAVPRRARSTTYALLRTRSWAWAVTAVDSELPALIGTRRGLAASAIGSRRVSTPFM